MAEDNDRRRATMAGLGGSGVRPRHVSATAPVSGLRDVRASEVKAVHRSVPRLLKTGAEVRTAPLDHRDAFVLSLIDGHLDVDAIVDVSGMHASELLTILERLAELGIVSLP